MTRYEAIQAEILENPKVWLITCVAGFIGSNLLEKLLLLSQKVVGLDRFSTGYHPILSKVEEKISNPLSPYPVTREVGYFVKKEI
ncbi:MAG: hypothetical protein HQ498_04890 [Pseudohongiella sp.]|nr:hypothetical protein [Pseudohongiella sp.]